MINKRSRTVLVAGPKDESQRLVAELRELGVDCWADRMDRVAADLVSLEWADALVVLDPSSEMQISHRRSLLDFRGPSLLVLPAPVPASTVSKFLDRGFDQVVPWSCSLSELVARVRRLIGEPVTADPLLVRLAG
jgi:hypothetical protein